MWVHTSSTYTGAVTRTKVLAMALEHLLQYTIIIIRESTVVGHYPFCKSTDWPT